MKRYIFFTVLIIIAVCLSIYFYTAAEPATQVSSQTGITVGKTAPQFSLKDTDGNTVQINAAKTKQVFVINFWATWCPPCREEMPELEKFYKTYGDKVEFFGIDEQEPADKVNTFIHDNAYTYPILLDTSGEIGQLFKVRAIPTTVIIDKNGTIVYRKSGGVTADELKNALAKVGGH